MLRFHTQTAGCTLTAQQPDNNIVRVTLQALAAVLGGTQCLHTNSLDEALALPTEDVGAHRPAHPADHRLRDRRGRHRRPAGRLLLRRGAHRRASRPRPRHYIAQDRRAWAAWCAAIEAGFIQQEIQDAAYAYQKPSRPASRSSSGVNRFQMQTEESLDILAHRPQRRGATRRRSCRPLRGRRDNAAVAAALAELEQAARGADNLMPPILDAVRAYATIGEICDAMRKVFGLYQENVLL